MKKYRIDAYGSVLTRIVIHVLVYAIFFSTLFIYAFDPAILVKLAHSLEAPFIVTLLLPAMILLSLACCISSLLYAYHLLSYSLSISSDGKIIESQFGTPHRVLAVEDILNIHKGWGNLYPAKNSFISKIPWFIRESFLGLFSLRFTTPFHLLGSQGLEFRNNVHANFPRYSISWKVLTDLRAFRPELTVDDVTEERIRTQQTIFAFAGMVLFVCLTLILFSIGVLFAFEDNDLHFSNLLNPFIIIGVICLLFSVYFWKRRYA